MFKNLFKNFKEKLVKSWLWLPLSLSVAGVYAIQRGLGVIAKTDMVPVFFSEALGIFFYTIAIGIFFCGIILDNIDTKKAILVGTVLGIIGLLGLPYSPWYFGLFFGSAAMLFKLAPFSAPLKIYKPEKNIALKISPQA